jgi:hypothetical protein
VQDLDLLVAHLVGREVDGRLHRQQAQELEHVVLHEVAQGARVVVVARAEPMPMSSAAVIWTLRM